MRKIKTSLVAYGLSAMLLLTGCADKGTLGQSTSVENGLDYSSERKENSNTGAEVELKPIAEVRENFDEEAEKIKNRKFDNINFENAYFAFPEADEFYTLEYEKMVTEIKWPPDEIYDYLCRRIDELIPGLYNDEQKAYEIRFPDAEPINKDTAEGLYIWPNFEQYTGMNLMTDHPVPIIYNKDCYIEIFYNALRGYDPGDFERYVGYDGDIDLFDALEELPVVYRTKNLESPKTYHLVSGDISIADAVKSANKVFSELELSPYSLPFKPAVQSVIVLDIGDGCFAFCFNIVTEYKQVQFNAIEMDDTCYAVSTGYDSTHEIDICDGAIMYEAEKITRYRMLSPFAISDITETNAHGSVIPFERAAEIASNYLTENIKFKALNATAVYKSFSAKDRSQYSEGDDYIHRKITVKPCWKFVLKPTTSETDKLYYVFVDMITGKSYTTVQRVEAGVEYD